MNTRLGSMVFARHDSVRLPGKTLRIVGGIPLLERVIRRAQMLPWPVYLATTEKPSDNALVALADRLGIESFRGSESNVLERGLEAAENFSLDGFARICGDRPLFPLDTLDTAMREAAMPATAVMPDLVSNCVAGRPVPGLTTEVVRTASLRTLLERGPTAEQQEHMTQYYYQHPGEFVVVALAPGRFDYRCPGFAVDTESDLARLNTIFDVSGAIDLTPDDADRMYRQ